MDFLSSHMPGRRGSLLLLSLAFSLFFFIPWTGGGGSGRAGYKTDLGGGDVDFRPPSPKSLFRNAKLADSLLKAADAEALGTNRVVVTLSTFPGRAEKIRGTIESLGKQTRKPDRIYVNLALAVKRLAKGDEDDDDEDGGNSGRKEEGAEQQTSALPPALAELEAKLGPDYLVILHPPDYGPSTKLLPTLLVERNPKTTIVVVDDDVVYHERTVETLSTQLLDSTRSKSGDAFFKLGHPACFCCEEPQWIRFGLFPWVRSQRSPGNCQGYSCAYAGEAFLRSHFPDMGLFNYSGVPKGCRLHDDVWIGGYLYRKGILPRLVTADFASVVSHRPWDELTVHSVPNTEKEYRNPCLEYFNWFR